MNKKPASSKTEERKAGRKFGESDDAKPAGKGKSSGKSGGKGTTPGKSGGKGARPITPVRVSSAKPWGTIAMFTVVGLIFVAIVGYTGYQSWYNSRSVSEQVALIDGVKDYRSDKSVDLGRRHKDTDLKYEMSPPVGGDHNTTWQNCQGDVYDAQIADEHAVHSLEHGAVWITYRPNLPKAQVKELAAKVQGKDFMMMSPYPGLKAPISLQAWGFQLKADSADDSRIDDFIEATRKKASLEPTAGCSEGVTVTGSKPRKVAPPQAPGGQPGMPGQPGAPPGAPPVLPRAPLQARRLQRRADSP